MNEPEPIPALSIRQPWAWLILHAGKDIENRTWPSHHRGRLLIHAAQGMTRMEYDSCRLFLHRKGIRATVPRFEELSRGGIVGAVMMTDCVTAHSSRWFTGPYGFVFTDRAAVAFIPLKGQQQLFHVPPELVTTP